MGRGLDRGAEAFLRRGVISSLTKLSESFQAGLGHDGGGGGVGDSWSDVLEWLLLLLLLMMLKKRPKYWEALLLSKSWRELRFQRSISLAFGSKPFNKEIDFCFFSPFLEHF